MLVGRGLERLDRSRSHHILSQEEVMTVFWFWYHSPALFFSFYLCMNQFSTNNSHWTEYVRTVFQFLLVLGGRRKDHLLARAGDHRHHQEPFSGSLATPAPYCSLPQWQLTLSHTTLHFPPPGSFILDTFTLNHLNQNIQNLKRLDLSNNKLRSLPAEIGDLHRFPKLIRKLNIYVILLCP